MNPKKKVTDSDAKLKKRREQKRKSMQKAREKLKSNEAMFEEAKAKERQRWHERRKKGSVKVISDLSEREKRHVRKHWREQAKMYRSQKKKDVNLDTSPGSPPENQIITKKNTPTSRIDSGKKTARKNREKLRLSLKNSEERCKKFENKAEKYRKKYNRLIKKLQERKPSEDDTPRKKMAVVLLNKDIDRQTKRRLFGNEIICQQIKKQFQLQKSRKVRRKWSLIFDGSLIKKYKCLEYAKNLTSRRMLSEIKKHKEALAKAETKREAIRIFLEKDSSSRICPGKKDTKTKNKIKKQKRYLNDTMENLLIQFRKENPQWQTLSKSTFCRYRPFWITAANAASRQTCLCKVHANFSFIVHKLKICKLIKEKCTTEVIESLCCTNYTRNCMERRCKSCLKKEIDILEAEDFLTEFVSYEKWVTKEIPIVVKKVEKLSKRTFKMTVNCTKEQLVVEFKKSIPRIMQHVANIKHQYTSIDNIRSNLKYDEVILHMDFSENYECKYGAEIQTVHFGGSKQQVTIHTSILYYCDPFSGEPRSQTFATLSSDNRHNAKAIAAHLEPIVKNIKQLIPQLKIVHFVSDGPSTQYRNKFMFQIFGSILGVWLKAEKMAWHYSESSHGKGAPDGVGGAIKRTADNIVGRGKDVSDFQTLVNILQKQESSINIIPIEENRITYFHDKINLQEAQTFVGTTKIHQVTWVKGNNFMQARRLSCITCAFDEKCTHFHLGKISIIKTTTHPFNNGQQCGIVKIKKKDASGVKKESTSVPSLHHKPCTSKIVKNHLRLKYTDVYSSSESEDEHDRSTSPRPLPNDYIVVKLTTKKTFRHFVARVLFEDSNGELNVRFLKRNGTKSFVVPTNVEEVPVDNESIVTNLGRPASSYRGLYTFEKDLSMYKNLC